MMNKQIAESNRRLVVIIDPHIKVDMNYHVFRKGCDIEYNKSYHEYSIK